MSEIDKNFGESEIINICDGLRANKDSGNEDDYSNYSYYCNPNKKEDLKCEKPGILSRVNDIIEGGRGLIRFLLMHKNQPRK